MSHCFWCEVLRLFVFAAPDVTTALIGVGLVQRNEMTGRVELDKGE